VLKAETLFVPKRLIILALNILETIVPQEIMTVTKLAKDMGRLEENPVGVVDIKWLF
jgi:hypothetical protein